MDYNFWAALMIGLLSSGHCFGMCGGVVGAFAANIPLHHRINPLYRSQYLLAYNVGRITSYCIAGATVGYSMAYFSIKSSFILYILQALAGCMLISMGLYLLNWLNLVSKIEILGKYLWPMISPVTRRFIPFKTPLSALPFGMLWGWLPCGLVYSTLTWSAASGSASNGALIMLGFGLGTLPALLSMGYLSQLLRRILNYGVVRYCCGLAIISYGASMLYKILIIFM